MTDNKQITIRVNEKLLALLKQKYFFLNNDSEVIRLAMIEALKGGINQFK